MIHVYLKRVFSRGTVFGLLAVVLRLFLCFLFGFLDVFSVELLFLGAELAELLDRRTAVLAELRATGFACYQLVSFFTTDLAFGHSFHLAPSGVPLGAPETVPALTEMAFLNLNG